MQSVFVILTKLMASKIYFCNEVFCNNFGRDGIHVMQLQFWSFLENSFCICFGGRATCFELKMSCFGK